MERFVEYIITVGELVGFRVGEFVVVGEVVGLAVGDNVVGLGVGE
jgi:hypothetical protein